MLGQFGEWMFGKSPRTLQREEAERDAAIGRNLHYGLTGDSRYDPGLADMDMQEQIADRRADRDEQERYKRAWESTFWKPTTRPELAYDLSILMGGLSGNTNPLQSWGGQTPYSAHGSGAAGSVNTKLLELMAEDQPHARVDLLQPENKMRSLETGAIELQPPDPRELERSRLAREAADAMGGVPGTAGARSAESLPLIVNTPDGIMPYPLPVREPAPRGVRELDENGGSGPRPLNLFDLPPAPPPTQQQPTGTGAGPQSMRRPTGDFGMDRDWLRQNMHAMTAVQVVDFIDMMTPQNQQLMDAWLQMGAF